MDLRQRYGLRIAAGGQIRQVDGVWYVPSETRKGLFYRLDPIPGGFRCECKDYLDRRKPCKHIHGRHYHEHGPAFSELLKAHRQVIPDPPVSRDWAQYNASKIEESPLFHQILRDLCDTLETALPSEHGGRPPIPAGDLLYALAVNEYSTKDARRCAGSMIRERQAGIVDWAPGWTTLIHHMNRPQTADLIQQLIQRTTLPLQTIERRFAIDATGFTSSQKFQWDVTHNAGVTGSFENVKLHIACGVTTHLVTAATVTEGHVNESPILSELLHATAKNFVVEAVSADKGYLSKRNLRVIDSLGAYPFIPFKCDSKLGKDFIWNKYLLTFQLHHEEWLKHYGDRPSVEATFWMIKKIFSEKLRSRKLVARQNEILLKVLCHNIRCLIRASFMMELPLNFPRTSNRHRLVLEGPEPPPRAAAQA